MYINTPKASSSKDDLYPTIYFPDLTNQFGPYFTTSHHSTLPYQYLPYLPKHKLYAKALVMYPMFGYEPLEPLGLVEGEKGRERVRWMRERLLRMRANHPPLPDAEVGKLVRGLAREVNFGVRKDAMARMRMGKGDDGMLGLTIKEMNDLGNDVRIWSERNGHKNGSKGTGLGDGDKGSSTSNPPWFARTSRVRNSGHFARWGGRMSTTTVGGFAGGGVPRPERDDPFTSAVMGRPVRVSVPAGLMKAAANPDQIQEWYPKRRGTTAEDGKDREWHHPRAKTSTTARMRPTSYSRAHIAHFYRLGNSQAGSTSQQSRRRRIPSLQSLGAPLIRPAKRSSTNLDLAWSSAASPMWVTTSSSDFSSTSDSKWSTSSDVSHSADEESLISAMAEAEPSSARTISPDDVNAMTAAELRHPTSALAPKTFLPGAFHVGDSSEDDERELLDNWPEPDHRYTHLGPGRGSSKRHLSAVNPLGFAGGGVPRRRASDVLPISLLSKPKVAVPDGLQQAAGRSTKECDKATNKTSKESEASEVSEEEKKARMFEKTFREGKPKMIDEMFEMIDEMFEMMVEGQPRGEKGKGLGVKKISTKRDSGKDARWGQRMSVTTAGMFAGGGDMRPGRDEVEAEDGGGDERSSKVGVPEGLGRATARSSVQVDREFGRENEAWVKNYWEEVKKQGFEMIDGVAVKEPDGEETKLLTIERASKDAITRTNRMSRYEVILSAALLLLAIMYAWEIHSRYTP